MGHAIEVRDVSKRFKLRHEKSLKERVLRLGRDAPEVFWALRDLEVLVDQGSTVGLIGHNGSGKSTLLKCIAGILRPTTGSITTTGRVAALLELGAGFQPDLTGRENVYLNGSILGLARREIARHFDDIVAFSELEQFIDTQVKHYSSGMFVRLGFAVAVNVDPDILLIDEVLAVGDEAFQRKCLDRVREFQREGRTIVFVTHAVSQVQEICDRAVVLDHGLVVADGEPAAAIHTFRDYLYSGTATTDSAGSTSVSGGGRRTGAIGGARSAPPSEMELRATKAVRIADVQFEYPEFGTRGHMLPNEPLVIRVRYRSEHRVDDVMCGLGIHDSTGRLLFGTNTKFLGVPIPPIDGEVEVVFRFATLPVLGGDYRVSFAVQNYDESITYDWSEQRHQIAVLSNERSHGVLAIELAVEVTP
jgi:ABC-2 type transport system ATP-binding protein